MSAHPHRTFHLLVAVLTGLPVLCAAGPTLPRLPADRDLTQSTDSPGVVTFSHAQHVDAARPDCTACHPRLFKMARTSAGAPATGSRHSEMDARRSCGACHNGRVAFSREDCDSCHRAH